MDDKLRNILSQDAAPAGEGKLLDYVNNNLTPEEQHELEMQMNDDEFMSDAFDGLQEVNNTGALPQVVHQLNAGLKKQLRKSKNKSRQKFFKEGPWIYFSIVLLLILAVVAFVVIRKFLEV